ncbi:MAG: thiamine ABC transporter substrate-binding protein [Thermoplasmatota archaeon]
MNPRLSIAPIAFFLLVAALSGCTTRTPLAPDEGGRSYVGMGFTGSDPTGRDGSAWPDLDGTTLTILDHGAFSAFGDAASRFENLTGAKVEHIEANDAGSALNQAVRDLGSPSADVIYGIDNVLLTRAEESGVLQHYRPLLGQRVQPEFGFFRQFGLHDAGWPATPVDHGYIAINVDAQHAGLAGANITDLDDVRDHADQFVTEDPNTSSVGLGFLLATIAMYGEDGWQDYWADLFEGDVRVTAGWSEAYEQHFSGGYGPSIGGRGDKPLVASYTESPAYEAFYGRPSETLAQVITVPNSTFQQIQTMAILAGTDDLAAAQAWIEFTLTDAFQELAAPGNAVYPVVPGIDVAATYGGLDPAPGSFVPASFEYQDLGANLERWLDEWTALCEAHDCR